MEDSSSNLSHLIQRLRLKKVFHSLKEWVIACEKTNRFSLKNGSPAWLCIAYHNPFSLTLQPVFSPFHCSLIWSVLDLSVNAYIIGDGAEFLGKVSEQSSSTKPVVLSNTVWLVRHYLPFVKLYWPVPFSTLEMDSYFCYFLWRNYIFAHILPVKLWKWRISEVEF